MRRFELLLAALCGACWIVILLDAVRVIALENHLVLGFYPLYAIAGFTGSFAGHAFVSRSRGRSLVERRRMLLVYVGGLPVVPILLRLMAPTADQEGAPLVPLLCVFVFTVFALVPLLLRRPASPPPPLPRDPGRRDGGRGTGDGRGGA